MEVQLPRIAHYRQVDRDQPTSSAIRGESGHFHISVIPVPPSHRRTLDGRGWASTGRGHDAAPIRESVSAGKRYTAY